MKSMIQWCAQSNKNQVIQEACQLIVESWEENNKADSSTENVQTSTYRLVSVVDWDTIKIEKDWKEISIRMIGVDSPESNSTRYGYIECYGAEASNHLKQLLNGVKEIEIELDETQGEFDTYNRMLAYVRVNGTNINQKMIEDWFAWEYTYNKAYQYQKEFQLAEEQANKNQKGLWSSLACDGERVAVENKTSSSPLSSNACGTSPLFVGVQWGCYYLNANGNKTYVDRLCCSAS